MKKRVLLGLAVLTALTIVLNACQGKSAAKTQEEPGEQPAVGKNMADIKQFLSEANQYVNQKVTLTGVITHICKHSGKRCFLADADGKETVRVEAGGKIVGFNRELVGSMVRVSGTLKERRLSNDYIDQWEEALNEKKVKEDGTAKTCAAENNNISRMRSWMKDNGKDYYSIFFIDGEDYEIVE